MHIMDQAPTTGLYEEESSLTPLSQALAPVKIEPLDMYTPQVPQPTSLDNDPTYTSLETVYPEAHPTFPDSQPFSSAYGGILYSTIMDSGFQDMMRYPFYRDDALASHQLARDEVFGQVPKDEGLGSSPSSMSSTSPPLPLHQAVPAEQQVLDPTTPPSGYEYSRYSTSSTPESVGSNYSTAPECSNCASRCDITWVETHFLCRKCLSDILQAQRPVPQLPTKRPMPQQQILCHNTPSNKRRKTVTTSKHLDQICSNCETPNSTLWRRSISDGQTVCNACGLYEKLHNRKRPVTMRKDTPQTRKRKTKASQQPKAKNSAKRNTKKPQDIEHPVQQQQQQQQHPHYQHQQYVPNNIQHYTLPTYNTFQGRELSPGMNNNAHQAAMLPPTMDENQTLYSQFRPDQYNIYNTVPPNEIIPVTMPSNVVFTSS